jgi:hypothetical protein
LLIIICFSVHYFVYYHHISNGNIRYWQGNSIRLWRRFLWNEDELYCFLFVSIVRAIMSTNFKIAFFGTFVHVQLDPGFEISPESMSRLWAELAEACNTYNCRIILAEGLLPSRRMNMAGAFVSGEQLARSVAGLTMACYFEGYKADELTEFFKTVARNRGTMVEFFSAREEAFKWLGVSPSNGQPAGKSGTGGVAQYLI